MKNLLFDLGLWLTTRFHPSVSQLTPEKFDALTERDKARLRGDRPAWETKWVIDLSFSQIKLELFASIVRTRSPRAAAKLTNEAFDILFKQPPEVQYVSA